MFLDWKLVVTKQDTASKDTFFLNNTYNISKQYRPKYSWVVLITRLDTPIHFTETKVPY